jgi:hypothetical protein
MVRTDQMTHDLYHIQAWDGVFLILSDLSHGLTQHLIVALALLGGPFSKNEWFLLLNMSITHTYHLVSVTHQAKFPEPAEH